MKWTPESIKAFETIKQAINDCPKLYYMLTHLPTYLYTDASDYGIGAYLFQLEEVTLPTGEISKIERPIAFASRALTAAQIKAWATPEKEAYAIVFAFQKFEHLIHDRHFILRTDHRNLTFVNTASSGRVRRWKLAIQDYDFDIEYVPGPDNIVSDAFSRQIRKEQRAPGQ